MPLPSRGRPHLGVLLWLLALASGCAVYEPSLLPFEATGSAGAPATGTRTASATAADCTGNKPTCTRANAATTCRAGQCRVTSCRAPHADCNQLDADGCEADLTSVAHCGGCDTRCSFPHGLAGCSQGRCALLGCEPGFADCDGLAANGCESSLTALGSCGACGRVCPASLAHGSAVCSDGRCVVQCQPGFGDCNARTEDGCEQMLTATGECGDCTGMDCVGPHVARAECLEGPCAIESCAPGFEDCNGTVQDGCESDLLAAQSCGGCRARCELPHVAATRCEAAAGGAPPQCSIDRSCGKDELDCSITRLRGCAPGYADCDGVNENGCETDLRRLNHCGGCGRSCVSAHDVTECRAGECVTTGCAPGHARCGDWGPCRDLSDDPRNCGACGRVCPASAPLCAGGRCGSASCSPGSADCNGKPEDGCEQSLNVLDHCGGCDQRCGALPHARAVSCQDARCQIGSCETGWADCDLDPKNGCEVSLDTDDDCGGCAMACHFPQGIAHCQDRKCQLTGCIEGRGDCNRAADDGCENDLRSADHCGACGHACNGLPHVAAGSCRGGRCAVKCQPGFADCNGNPDDGCEADLTRPESCGRCGNDCSALPNASGGGCAAGSCTGIRCNPGYGDCDGSAANGCERPLNTLSDCGACQKSCQPAHASGDCSAGSCNHASCEPGYGDCDGNAANGCETSLNSPSHCGGCGMACEGGAPCKNGKCGCARDAQCGQGESCCNNACVNTVGECFPWPCIPGTALPDNTQNCGGCGDVCVLFCCGPLL